jgi:hypothetical protein
MIIVLLEKFLSKMVSTSLYICKLEMKPTLGKELIVVNIVNMIVTIVIKLCDD